MICPAMLAVTVSLEADWGQRGSYAVQLNQVVHQRDFPASCIVLQGLLENVSH